MGFWVEGVMEDGEAMHEILDLSEKRSMFVNARDKGIYGLRRLNEKQKEEILIFIENLGKSREYVIKANWILIVSIIQC